MRSTRNAPFCWQEKKILRILRNKYTGSALVKMRCLYGAITEMDSDFNSQEIKYYTKTIHTYSGLSTEWIPTGLKALQDLKIIQVVEDRENGRFKGKRLIFTPENISEIPRKTVTGKPNYGKPFVGKDATSEDSSSSEDSPCNEDSNKSSTTSHNEKYIYLSKILYDEHLNADPQFLAGKDKRKTFLRWANDIRLLITVDKRPAEQVADVIRWCQSPGCFWVPNILSGKKLREKYPVLFSQMVQEKNKNKPPEKKPKPLDLCSECGNQLPDHGYCDVCQAYT